MFFSTIFAAPASNCEDFAFNVDCLSMIEAKGIMANNPGYLVRANIGSFFSGTFGITNLLFVVAGLLILFYTISAGIGFMTSQGDPAGVAANKQKLTNALAGFVLLLSAYWIVKLAATLLGLGGITATFAPPMP